jgi:hypothetical protein
LPRINFIKLTLLRLDDFINQINLLKEVEFPYDDSSKALDDILVYFRFLRNSIKGMVLETEHAKTYCSIATQKIFRYHRFLGYIAKSADPINSFEIYFSFRRLAKAILTNDIKLIISSEWDSYSPINFTIPTELKNYVFIGLPVAESENSLIVPLSGHELGHSIWINKSRRDFFINPLQDLLKRQNLQISVNEKGKILEMAMNKCEEYYCDMIGMGLFGESYIYAFAYLSAPNIRDSLGSSHPNPKNRAEIMLKAANRFKAPAPENIMDLYKIRIAASKLSDEQILEISDELAFNMTDMIIEDVERLLISQNVLYQKSTNYRMIIKDFLDGAPTNSAKTLADITNASWELYFNRQKWRKLGFSEKQKNDFLNELTIKSFELLEIKQRLNHL